MIQQQVADDGLLHIQYMAGRSITVCSITANYNYITYVVSHNFWFGGGKGIRFFGEQRTIVLGAAMLLCISYNDRPSCKNGACHRFGVTQISGQLAAIRVRANFI